MPMPNQHLYAYARENDTMQEAPEHDQTQGSKRGSRNFGRAAESEISLVWSRRIKTKFKWTLQKEGWPPHPQLPINKLGT